MPKFTFFISLFVFCLLTAEAQEQTKYEFSGFLKLADSSIITYKINFQLSDGVRFEGSSVTDIYGTEKTKTSIRGEWDKNKKQISFREISNIATKSQASQNEFCYIQVSKARVKSKGGKSFIEGKFNGVFEDAKPCADGNIFLIGTDFLYEKPTGKDSVKLSGALPVQKLIQKSNETKLSSGEILVMNSSSSSVSLELWDGMKEDNDRVTVAINNKAVLTDYELTQNKKIIDIPLNTGECIIHISAENEGRAPPNTAHILLRDKDLSTPLLTSLKKGEKTTIKIRKIAAK